MNEAPLVSVVIPTYKRSVQVLSRAVRSVREQTYANVELIVVDDSPADYPGREEVRRYMEPLAGDGVIYLQNERNMGGSLARNRGVSASHGAYIAFLDDDDAFFPD